LPCVELVIIPRFERGGRVFPVGSRNYIPGTAHGTLSGVPVKHPRYRIEEKTTVLKRTPPGKEIRRSGKGGQEDRRSGDQEIRRSGDQEKRLRPERGAGGKRRAATPPSESERGWGPASK